MAVVAVVAVVAAVAAPIAVATPSPGAARLQGQFVMHGKITVAVDVRGEHVGQKVVRRWTFVPACATGPCASIRLTRQRSGGVDHLVLRRGAPADYSGRGSFYAPLRCGSRLWRRGEYVPFTITVKITTATVAGGVVIATRIRATYKNVRRVNRTPCVTPLIHDGARYRGQLVQSSTGGAGPQVDGAGAQVNGAGGQVNGAGA